MSWAQAEEDRRQEQQSSQFLKVPKDSPAVYIVLLSQPTKQNKVDGTNVPFSVYTVDVWNAMTKRKQTFDMAPRAFDALVALKNRIGENELMSSVLVLIRTQGATQYDVKWAWGQDQGARFGWETVLADMRADGIVPLGSVVVEARPVLWANQLQRLRAAPNMQALQEAFQDVMSDMDLPNEAMEPLTKVFNQCKRMFQSKSDTDQGGLDTATDIKSLQALFVAAYNKAKAKGDTFLCQRLQETYNQQKGRFTAIAEPQL